MQMDSGKEVGGIKRADRSSSRWAIFRWSLILLLALELFVRSSVMLLPKYEYKPGWGLVPVENSVSVQGKEGFGVTRYLEDGEIWTPYRDGDHIVVLGDSTVKAAQVNDTDNFVSLAEMALRRRGLAIDLHNFGASERAVSDHVYIAPMLISKFQPRFVVIQVSLASFVLSMSEAHDNHFVVESDGSLTLVHREPDQDALRLKNALYSSGLLSLIDYRWQMVRPTMTLSQEGFVAKAAEQPVVAADGGDAHISFELLSAQVRAIQDAYQDVPVIFLIVPYTPAIYPETPYELSWNSGNDNILAIGLNNIDGVHVVVVREEFQQVYNKRLVLPRGSFNSLFNFGHLNRDGHRVVSFVLTRALEGLLK